MPTRVLLVDDDDDLLFGFKEMLESPDVRVSAAVGADQALALLQDDIFDVLIADLMLGNSDPEGGLNLIRYVKAHAKATKTIVITGCGDPDIVDRAMAAGTDLFYAKPVAAKVLKDAIRTFLL